MYQQKYMQAIRDRLRLSLSLSKSEQNHRTTLEFMSVEKANAARLN